MADTLKDVPEFFETEIGESIVARTDALGNLILNFPTTLISFIIY